ncbi:putative Vesicle-associated membrane protein [Zostera marina]|uniref:Putative Vesicle-associated membrane protein n=1 Tax=Zostera marina TaxID=29655 RepID=A0A0K9NQ43_ZOSMR|nr:putative Vesicle-associated membrane protein [Zostera marina]
MAATDMNFISVDPIEICFAFELNQQISCSLRLSNKTEDHVGFKVKTTSPKKYCVRPNSGILPPRSSSDITITMQAQKEAPVGMLCRDKFLIQSILVDSTLDAKDVTSDMFSSTSKYVVEEARLGVVFNHHQSSASSSSAESSMPAANGDPSSSRSPPPVLVEASCSNIVEERKLIEPDDDNEKKQQISQPPQAVLQEHQELRQKSESSFPVVVVVVIAVVAILLAYLIKKN